MFSSVSQIDHDRPAISRPPTIKPKSSQRSPGATVPATVHIMSQVVNDSVLHSDQRTQIAVKVPTVRSASDMLHAEVRALVRFAGCFISRNEPKTTSVASIAQNNASCS